MMLSGKKKEEKKDLAFPTTRVWKSLAGNRSTARQIADHSRERREETAGRTTKQNDVRGSVMDDLEKRNPG